jgi:septal ring factor EnvC (AmiA/AmiB activator)
MTVKPVEAVAEDAAKLLSDAVVRVTTEAIQPTFEPFKNQLTAATRQLLGQADELRQLATEQDEVLAKLKNHIIDVCDATAKQLAAAATQQAAVDEAVLTVREIGGDLSNATRGAAAKQVDAAARQQAAVDEAVRAVGKIGSDLSSATRDLTGLTQQLTRFRRLLAASVGIGALALAAGAAALLLALG